MAKVSYKTKVRGRLAWDKNLREVDEKGMYNLRILMTKEEIQKVQNLINQLKKDNPTTEFLDDSPIHDGNKLLDKEGKPRTGYENMFYINAKSKFEIELYDRAANIITDLDKIKELFYCGVDGMFNVSVFKYKHPSKPKAGIGCGCSGIQSLQTGEPMFSRGSQFDPFDAAEVVEEDDEKLY